MCCRVEIRREWEDKSGTLGAATWTIDKVESVEITGDGESLQDTCTVKLPRNAHWGVSGSEIPIRRGDGVRVWLGYDGALQLRFVGHVKEVAAKTPTVITCEDEMFRLRQKAAKKLTYTNCTLKRLLDDQLQGMSIARSDENADVQLGMVRVEATTVAGVLSELKKNYGITSYFALVDDVPTLFCFTVFPGLRRNAGRFSEGVNIIENALVSFAFNVGLNAFAGSTLCRKVKANPDDKTIAEEFSRWVYAGGKKLAGLVRRRQEEASKQGRGAKKSP